MASGAVSFVPMMCEDGCSSAPRRPAMDMISLALVMTWANPKIAEKAYSVRATSLGFELRASENESQTEDNPFPPVSLP